MKWQILLSRRQHGQDLTLRCWLVDIFTNMQINLIDLFNFLYRGDAKDISHLISFGKFCFSPPGQKIVCKILLDQCEDSLDFDEWILKEILFWPLYLMNAFLRLKVSLSNKWKLCSSPSYQPDMESPWYFSCSFASRKLIDSNGMPKSKQYKYMYSAIFTLAIWKMNHWSQETVGLVFINYKQ